MSAENVHLLVLVHGMWGHPGHLAAVRKTIGDLRCQPSSATGPGGERLEVLLAETNREDNTYDGIDWGGERVAEEIYEHIKQLEEAGKKVTRFSITGYSLGGLIARYVIGILYQRRFFETVTAVNFNTFATPHIGLPKYPTVFSSVTSYLGPKLLSRTGEQFWAIDKWSARGRPVLEVMADPDRPFYQALCLFRHLRIYANAVNDMTVAYPTAAIEDEDIFVNHATNGINIELDEQYSPIIKSYSLPEVQPAQAPPPKPLTADWWKRFRVSMPPALQFSFPYNILIYISLPIVFPLLLTLILSRLSLASRASRQRLKHLEKDESSVDRLIHVLAKLERDVEDAVADIIDDPGAMPASVGASAHTLTPDSETHAGWTTPGLEKAVEADTPTRPQHVILSDLQLRLVKMLNTLPNLQKERAFIHPVRNAHAVIVCRDLKRFEFHKMGEGVLRHWADHFIM
ncbi:uncharacterized protein FIBRA_08448 [Fibroporia radiculosa]|uniref:DUF676 domain-containing protein n=1 Tax=Fibroporia radiculosa TaxID=599839 RepID=J4GWT9_9APHY|nr:uncharacterized protein FIBRA_08448 [Fibroporia radiculosa]CCM06205.1 predicted protein [Fibroporia radiculosa]